MGDWRTRWQRARRYGFGQAWRSGIAYALHDSVVIRGKPIRGDVARFIGFGQRPGLFPTARPGTTPGWDIDSVEAPLTFQPPVPRAWSDDGARARPLTLPATPRASTLGVRRLRVRDVTIQPGQSLIVGEHVALVPELLDRVAVGPGVWEPGAKTCISPWRKRREIDAIDPAVTSRLADWTATLWRREDASWSMPRAISLFETVDDHFGHGMLDLLHRLRAVTDLPPSWPIVVSQRMPPNIVAWINRIAPERQVLRVKHGQVVHVDDLVAPLESGRLWLDPGRLSGSGTVPATIDPTAMQWLQDLGSAESRHRSKRVWIRRDRSPHARILNESQLVDQARKHGFHDVFLQDLTLGQVRELMSEVSHVIAPMASAVANLTMASAGVRVLQLTDELTWRDRYGSLTWLSHIGHEHAVLVGRQETSGFTVSRAALEETMKWLLSDEQDC